MHGIVGRALGRFYDETSSQEARDASVGISEWLTCEGMGPKGRFYYKQAPKCKGGRYGANSQCITAIGYAYVLTQDPWFGEILEALYDQTGPSVRSMSWYPQALSQLNHYRESKNP